MTIGAMTILSQQYGSDNGDNRKGLKSVKNSQKISEKFNFFYLGFLKKYIFCSFWWILTTKGKNGNFWNFFPHFFNFQSIFGNFKRSN